jgi:hypothetical protein
MKTLHRILLKRNTDEVPDSNENTSSNSAQEKYG